MGSQHHCKTYRISLPWAGSVSRSFFLIILARYWVCRSDVNLIQLPFVPLPDTPQK